MEIEDIILEDEIEVEEVDTEFLKGKDGYTPIKGVDYYTEAEKQEFIDNIKNGIQPLLTEISQNEAARNASETIRVSNETERVNAENVRNNNELTRTESEETRKSNESIRVANENIRNQNEELRKTAENTRVTKEVERQNNETIREENEEARKTQESSRQSAENIRKTSEDERKAAENVRVSNENTRISNENIRIENETAREEVITKLQKENAQFKEELEYVNNVILENVFDKAVSEDRTMPNAAPLNADITFEGRSTQETRSGKNLLNANNIKFNGSVVYNGIIIENNGKTLKMPIYSSGNGYTETKSKLSELCPDLKVGDVVYLLATTTSTNNYIYLNKIGSIIRFGNSITITQNHLDSEVILYGNRYQDGETGQIIITDLRIVKNATDEWEPYGAMPSPEYPSEIKSVDGWNKFDYTKLTHIGIIDDNGTIQTKNERLWSDYIKVNPNQKIYFKTTAKSSENEDIFINRVICYGQNKEFIKRLANYTSYGDKEIDIPNDTYYIIFDLRTSALRTSLSNLDLKDNTQISTENLPYQPYGHYISEVIQNKNLCISTEIIPSSIDIYFNKNKNKAITISLITDVDLTLNSVYLFTNGNQSRVGSISGAANTKISTTIELSDSAYNDLQNAGSWKLKIYKSNATFTKVENCQIEEGSTPTPYTPHQETNITIPLQQPFRSIGETRDRFEKVDGKWYEVHKIIDVLFDNLSFSSSSSYSELEGHYRYNSTYAYLKIGSDNRFMSDIFKSIAYTDANDGAFGIVYNASKDNGIRIETDISTISEFINKIKGHHLYCVATTPQYLECTEEQVQVLEKKIRLYDGMNYISSLNEVEAKVNVEYYKKKTEVV